MAWYGEVGEFGDGGLTASRITTSKPKACDWSPPLAEMRDWVLTLLTTHTYTSAWLVGGRVGGSATGHSHMLVFCLCLELGWGRDCGVCG